MLAGQAQKEFFVNEAFARIDMLMHPVVMGERAAPPMDPLPGDAYLVGRAATGDWAEHENELAGWDGSQWTYVLPTREMRVFDLSEGMYRRYHDVWQSCPAPIPPSGGTTVDTEARAAIDRLVEMLRFAGIAPA